MIKNINKRFIVSGVALTLLPSVLSGCSAGGFKYYPDENNQITPSGYITYDTLKNYYIVEIDNPDFDSSDYYIAKRNTIKPLENLIYVYTDVLTDKEVFRRKENGNEYFDEGFPVRDIVTNRKFVKEIIIEDYLLSENFIKSTYTVDDIKQILNAIKENENAKEKELVKE